MSQIRSEVSLPDAFIAVLREADTTILSMAGKSHHLLYRMAHHYARRLAPVDSFYVGFYREGGTIVFPYSFDGDEYDDPEAIVMVPDGLGAKILKDRRAYRHDHDDGVLLNRGKSFGDTERMSRDCVVVPIVENVARQHRQEESTVIGLMGLLSYEPHVFGDQEEGAFQWIADAVGIVLTRESEDTFRQKALGINAESDLTPALRMDMLVGRILEKMADSRRRVRHIKKAAATGDARLSELIDTMYQEFEQGQTETIEAMLDVDLRGANPVDSLSVAERRVAKMLATAYHETGTYRSSKSIAEELYVGEATVKDHRKEINKVLGASGQACVRKLALMFYGSAEKNPPRH